jgi:hypothetical protein
MKSDYTHIEQVRNVLEVLRLIDEVKLTQKEVFQIRTMAIQYLDALLPERMTP